MGLRLAALRAAGAPLLELFVNDMTILTASMGTFERYRSRKRRMLYHMFNGDGFLPCLSHDNFNTDKVCNSANPT